MIQPSGIIEEVQHEIGRSFDGNDNFSFEMRESNLIRLLNECFVEIASETEEFVTRTRKQVLKTEINGTAQEAMRHNKISSVGEREYAFKPGNDGIGSWEFATSPKGSGFLLPYPPNYLNLIKLRLDEVDACEKGNERMDWATVSGVIPVYSTTENGWMMEVLGDSGYSKLSPGSIIECVYRHYPKVGDPEIRIQGNPMNDRALFHLMMFRLLSKRQDKNEEGNALYNAHQESTFHHRLYQDYVRKLRMIAKRLNEQATLNITPYFGP